MDIAPTVLSLFGLEVPADMQGTALPVVPGEVRGAAAIMECV
jgi:hypothetical protein